MNIPYTYLAVLLVFTLLVGVVIGDRLAAGGGPGVDGGNGGGHSGACAGLASARLHACVHRHGNVVGRGRQPARTGGTWPDGGSCDLAGGPRDDED